VANYSEEELLSAVRSEIRANNELRENLVQAVETKNKNWLLELVSWVAKNIFGAIIRSIVSLVVGDIWDDQFHDHSS
jgi:hypothetical protein